MLTIIVCGSLVPDPLQTLEPIAGPTGPALKNEMMLPSWLDPWAGHALYEAANLAARTPGSKVYLVSLGPKAKLQQVMMTVAQKVPFELIALDGSAGGFTDAAETAAAIAEAISAIPGLDHSKLLVFGGWESASRGAGATLQIVGERLGITEQFQGVDALEVQPDGSLRILERVEGGKHQVSVCAAPARRVGLGHRQPPGTPQQPASRHGQHARHHAVPAESQARSRHHRRPHVRQCFPPETNPHHPDRERRSARTDRGGFGSLAQGLIETQDCKTQDARDEEASSLAIR